MEPLDIYKPMVLVEAKSFIGEQSYEAEYTMLLDNPLQKAFWEDVNIQHIQITSTSFGSMTSISKQYKP